MTVQRLYTAMQTHISPFIEQPEIDLLIIFLDCSFGPLSP